MNKLGQDMGLLFGFTNLLRVVRHMQGFDPLI